MKYETAVDELLSRIPAFAEAHAKDEARMAGDENLPTVVFGSFARFLANLAKQKPEEHETPYILSASFKLLNEMATSSNDEVINLAEIGTFEVLTDTPEGIRLARQYLHGQALETFERIVSWSAPHAEKSSEGHQR